MEQAHPREEMTLKHKWLNSHHLECNTCTDVRFVSRQLDKAENKSRRVTEKIIDEILGSDPS